MTPIGDGRAAGATDEHATGSRTRGVRGQRLDPTTFRLLCVLAVLTAVAVVVLALRLRIVEEVGAPVRLTVVDAFGPLGLVAAFIPLAAAGVVIPLCLLARRRGSRDARTAALVAASTLLAAVVIATVTLVIGIVALPTAAILFGLARSPHR